VKHLKLFTLKTNFVSRETHQTFHFKNFQTLRTF